MFQVFAIYGASLSAKTPPGKAAANAFVKHARSASTGQKNDNDNIADRLKFSSLPLESCCAKSVLAYLASVQKQTTSPCYNNYGCYRCCQTKRRLRSANEKNSNKESRLYGVSIWRKACSQENLCPSEMASCHMSEILTWAPSIGQIRNNLSLIGS